MRKLPIIVLFFTLAETLSCFGGEVKYKVTGKKAPTDGAVVRLIDKLTASPIDSAIVSKGCFEMDGKAGKDAFLVVTVDGSPWNFMFFCDGKAVNLDVADSTLVGSALNTKLSDCAIENARAYARYNRFIEDFMSLSGEEQAARIEEWMPQYRTRIKEYADFYLDLITKNKDSLIPVAFIENFPNLISAANEWDKEAGDKAFNDILSSDSPCAKHPYVLEFKRKMEEADRMRAEANARRRESETRALSFVGQKFKDLEEPDPDGNPHKLSEYVGRGHWVLVDFWAAWCNPCKAEMPNVVVAYKKYHGKGFEIVGLSFDRSREDWLQAIKDWEMPWIHLSDLKYWQTAAAQTYSVTGIPDNLLIDPEGTIVARGLYGEALEAKLAEIFR